MKKIFALLVLIVVLSFSFCFAFNDVSKSHWACDTINAMSQKGLVKGYEDGSFKPEKEVTREEFMQLMFNVMSATHPLYDIVVIGDYADVDGGRWSHDAIDFYGKPLIETIGSQKYFYPTKAITRQEVALVLSKYFNYKIDESEMDGISSNDKKSMRDYLNKEMNVKDSASIDDEKVEAVINVYQSGLMKGVSEDSFAPTSSLTRAQAATIIYRVYNNDTSSTSTPTSQSDLDLSFLKLENKSSNLIYSPLSIKYAMKMLSEGADGKTKEEIDNLVANYNLTKYKNIDKVLSLANSIYIRDRYEKYVSSEFINTVKNKYDAEIKIDGFKNAKNANKWIEDKTFGIIKNMLKDEMFEADNLEMLLINALAIDMEWENSFSDESTRGRNFTKADNSKIIATTMNNSYYGDDLKYYIDNKVTAVKMDLKKYDDVELEFMAVMPSDNLQKYAETITIDGIKTIDGKMQPASTNKDGVILYIPKFSYEYNLDFEEDLKKLGMKEAFDEHNADFTKMTNNPVGLFVSSAFHKANIDFTEKGIKAAAVTIFAMADKAMISFEEPKPIIINIDKPFLYLIKDKKTGEIWFVGTMYEPNLWKNDMKDYEMKF